mgnify:CR=1 FL=1
MILVIDMCQKIGILKDEFVRPITDIIGDCHVVHYLDDYDWRSASHIILTGTALADDAYLDHIGRFAWLKERKVPMLGICAGMQVIARTFGASVVEEEEIGFIELVDTDGTLGIEEHDKAFALHHLACECPAGFSVCARSGSAIQMIQHDDLPIYGVLFHPEVLNKNALRRFISLD